MMSTERPLNAGEDGIKADGRKELADVVNGALRDGVVWYGDVWN